MSDSNNEQERVMTYVVMVDDHFNCLGATSGKRDLMQPAIDAFEAALHEMVRS